MVILKQINNAFSIIIAHIVVELLGVAGDSSKKLLMKQVVASFLLRYDLVQLQGGIEELSILVVLGAGWELPLWNSLGLLILEEQIVT